MCYRYVIKGLSRSYTTNMKDLSILVISYNVRDYLLGCLASIYAEPLAIDFEVIVVDNVSRDGSAEAVRQHYPQVVMIERARNVGLAAGTNLGLAAASGRYILYLNPDTRVNRGALEGMVRFADVCEDATAYCCRVLNDDGSLQHSCFRFPHLKTAFYGFFPLVEIDAVANGRYPTDQYDHIFEPEHILGAYLLTRRNTIDHIGGWDEKFFMYFEETDYCYRLKQAGCKALYNPAYSLIHYGGRSTSQATEKMSVAFYRSQAYFYRKHYGLWQFLALKGIVLCGTSFWVARSVRAYLLKKIDAQLLRTRLSGYAKILVA